MSETILIIEDETEIAELVRDYLEAEGFTTVLAANGKEGLEQFQHADPSLVLLDLMLPEIDGMEVCRSIRSTSTVPVLMMTAKRSETDKIIGLGIGADDYITKPFSPGELTARVKAHLRRSRYFSAQHEQGVLRYGELILDEKQMTVKLSERDLLLSAREFQILYVLAKRPGQVYSKEQLFNEVWGYDHLGDFNSLNVYIRKLREKLETDPSQPRWIQTVWGVGYKFIGDGK
ncbi:response regulator transcription factor [Jeotgalibacillus salarius]|uniref:Response regulator transcription factor n=1 Tax=Jeotgalibacillus salarius TaxID=546023 RepID=A0A4Y8LHH9_9BACL|nr:response regulator transcription factor [Jeotgalibacillus salarius]TFE02184.1 response regulator transcription factor [Jeotgalibacillus salarius]